MIDFTPGEIALGIAAVIALIGMWRILTIDPPEDTEENHE